MLRDSFEVKAEREIESILKTKRELYYTGSLKIKYRKLK